MAVISRRYGYLFIHAPRTGGTALAEKVLEPALDGTLLPPSPVEVTDRAGRSRRVGQHITLPQLLEAGLVRPDETGSLLTFTTVRNPFDSLVSLYTKKRFPDVNTDPRLTGRKHHEALVALAGQSSSFADFLERRFGEARRPRHLYPAHLEGADVVMRFEQLQADLSAVLDRLGVEGCPEIPRHNATIGRDTDYRTYYTDAARQLVERVFAPDLERFGYQF
jgi:hypothetical protein